MNWREKQKQELKQHLYDVAIKLFTDEGYEETSVISICNTAGVAKGTFFNYFASKEAVLSHYMRVITANGLSKTNKSLTGDIATDILQVFLDLLEQARKNEVLFAITCRVTPTSDELQREESDLDDDIETVLKNLIAQGIQNEQFRADLESDVLSPLLIATLTVTAHEWASRGNDFNLEYEITRRVNYLLDNAKINGI